MTMKHLIYIIQCITGQERKLIQQIKTRFPQINFFLPQKELLIRRQGKTRKETSLLFPGYIFLSNLNDTDTIFHYAKDFKGFIKFLWNNKDIRPLSKEETQIFLSLIENGEILKMSKGFFENQKIHITEGPLKNLSGKIIKIDKRKNRAKIEIKFFNRVMYSYLGLEILKKS